MFQKLSPSFIEEFDERVDWKCIKKYQKDLPRGFFKKNIRSIRVYSMLNTTI